jgi:hypothetical protein
VILCIYSMWYVGTDVRRVCCYVLLHTLDAQELPVWNSNPDKSKNFLGACLLKRAHSGGNSSTRSARCWGDGLESQDR